MIRLQRLLVPPKRVALHYHPSRSLQSHIKGPSFTAACCIIGDEILNGKTKDTNAHFLAKYLFDMGITLKKIEVVPDDTKAIADSVTQLSSHHHIVFTSGGIGPTMDDISYDAIAKAYGVDLSLDDETCQRMKDMAQRQSNDPVWELTDARKRMALFPTGANILRVDPKLWVPVVVVNNNIHILPGVPRLFEQLVHGLRPHIEQTMASLHMTPTKFHRVEIATSESEGIIAPVLNTLQDKFANVSIGSYPKWGLGPQGERVVVSIVGKDEQCVHQAAKEIQEGIQGWVYQQDSCP